MIRYTARFLFRKPKGTAVSLPYADRSTQYGSFRRQQEGSSPFVALFINDMRVVFTADCGNASSELKRDFRL